MNIIDIGQEVCYEDASLLTTRICNQKCAYVCCEVVRTGAARVSDIEGVFVKAPYGTPFSRPDSQPGPMQVT